jgi:hypothetical protein
VFIIIIAVTVAVSQSDDNCRFGMAEWLYVVLSFLAIQFVFMIIAEVILSRVTDGRSILILLGVA